MKLYNRIRTNTKDSMKANCASRWIRPRLSLGLGTASQLLAAARNMLRRSHPARTRAGASLGAPSLSWCKFDIYLLEPFGCAQLDSNQRPSA